METWKKGKKLHNGQYIIESMSLRGGLGITYKAMDVARGKVVALKAIEKVWQNFEQSASLEKPLIKQAVKIARCNHPSLVRVYPEVFQEDNLVYMVMEYIEGDDLASFVDRYGKLGESEALGLITKIASAINLLHQNRVLHQRIKPQNIILDKISQEPIFVDYGLAIKLFAFEGDKIKNAMTDAFAPPELTQEKVKIGAYTDIYSLAAILYVLVTGQLPTPSQFRQYKDLISPQQLSPNLSDRTNEAILKGMSVNPQERPKFIRDWFNLLPLEKLTENKAPTATTKKQPTEEEENPTTSPTNSEISISLPPEEDFIIGDDQVIPLKNNQNPLPENNLVTDSPTIENFEFDSITIQEKKKLFGLVGGIDKQVITRKNKFFVEYLGEGVNLEMIFIPAGTFLMGSPNDDSEKEKDETPPYRVNIFPFYMSKYPITQAQWRFVSNLPKVKRFLNENPSGFKGDNLPVEKVSWDDAQEFCARLKQYTKRGYRLPSEAEWEYACRGGSNSIFSFGNIINPQFANYDNRKNSNNNGGNDDKFDRKTTPVDSFFPNGFGLYDCHGNVWEWCQDHYTPNYTNKSKDGSAFRSQLSTTPRVVRGGSWSLPSNYCRSAKRSSYVADSTYNFIGFRVACILDG
ncbi:SUMF1/EgtB/PvdO family nonheme iron enzyme [Cyanobacterium stanieri LEGE 03274]|uniref:SUMF1/EgtB/PvdO family nonheme iron enzyme n=1 Tax=Cyanobacterium stanieri LEGE 03274 TaxID=1828756 RepID=A0ABR9V1S1_9CHRO|nr:bifunctional serine/threonine-protein kinase/formylglycine-generating enzyme family protein [Cyanobacterium stanieri]MBE9221499.1 SUMF1/EgtB/PvdO family nonheme iron enzyme [Cyanobacterium stanieri LEGE 03274]